MLAYSKYLCMNFSNNLNKYENTVYDGYLIHVGYKL